MKRLFYKLPSLVLLIFVLHVFIFAQSAEREQGIALYKKGDYAGAVRILKKAAKTDSSDAQSWYFLGLSHLGAGDRKEASGALEKAVAADGKNADFRAGLALVYMLRNKLPEARREAEAALAINQNIAEAQYILGVYNYRNFSYESAYERAKNAIQINPKFAAAYLLKSESLVSGFADEKQVEINTKSEKGRVLKEATEDLEKYLSLEPNNESAEFQREYLESLKFFAEYYNRNPVPASFDGTDEPAAIDKTPIKILSKKSASYSYAAREAGISGTVRLLVGFSAEGKISHILVVRALGFGLDREAVKAARAIKFVPATENGKAVSVVKTVEYSFSIY